MSKRKNDPTSLLKPLTQKEWIDRWLAADAEAKVMYAQIGERMSHLADISPEAIAASGDDELFDLLERWWMRLRAYSNKSPIKYNI